MRTAPREGISVDIARKKQFLMNWGQLVLYTDKKENQTILIYEEIQNGAIAKSYMRKGFLKYEEMRKYLTIYEEAVSHIWHCNCSIATCFQFSNELYGQLQKKVLRYALRNSFRWSMGSS